MLAQSISNLNTEVLVFCTRWVVSKNLRKEVVVVEAAIEDCNHAFTTTTQRGRLAENEGTWRLRGVRGCSGSGVHYLAG